MNRLLMALLTIMLLAGCAQEFTYVDQEWGKAQRASWAKQVANPDYKYAGSSPSGLEGINAEEVMNGYNQTFTEKTTETNVFEFGVTSSASE